LSSPRTVGFGAEDLGEWANYGGFDALSDCVTFIG
jgi:hypothetical protein